MRTNITFTRLAWKFLQKPVDFCTKSALLMQIKKVFTASNQLLYPTYISNINVMHFLFSTANTETIWETDNDSNGGFSTVRMF